MGARGIGEIGITGVGAAVANAVFNATGKRIRDLPLTLDKLMRGRTGRDGACSPPVPLRLERLLLGGADRESGVSQSVAVRGLACGGGPND